MLWVFGGAQGEQPGGVGVWLVQFVLLFLESSRKGHKAASAGGSNTGAIHSWGMKIVIYIHQVSKFSSLFAFSSVSFFCSTWVGWTVKEAELSFGLSKLRSVKQRASGQIKQPFLFFIQGI